MRILLNVQSVLLKNTKYVAAAVCPCSCSVCYNPSLTVPVHELLCFGVLVGCVRWAHKVVPWSYHKIRAPLLARYQVPRVHAT